MKCEYIFHTVKLLYFVPNNMARAATTLCTRGSWFDSRPTLTRGFLWSSSLKRRYYLKLCQDSFLAHTFHFSVQCCQSFIRTGLLLITIYNICTYGYCKPINLLEFLSILACRLCVDISALLNSGIIMIIITIIIILLVIIHMQTQQP